jgi:hypothetical protein
MKAKLELVLGDGCGPCGQPMSQGVRLTYRITVAPALTCPLACGRVGTAKSVLGKVDVSGRETS